MYYVVTCQSYILLLWFTINNITWEGRSLNENRHELWLLYQRNGAFRKYTLCRKSNILGLLRTISNSAFLGLVSPNFHIPSVNFTHSHIRVYKHIKLTLVTEPEDSILLI
jgi:hypothetical protein